MGFVRKVWHLGCLLDRFSVQPKDLPNPWRPPGVRRRHRTQTYSLDEMLRGQWKGGEWHGREGLFYTPKRYWTPGDASKQIVALHFSFKSLFFPPRNKQPDGRVFSSSTAFHLSPTVPPCFKKTKGFEGNKRAFVSLEATCEMNFLSVD